MKNISLTSVSVLAMVAILGCSSAHATIVATYSAATPTNADNDLISSTDLINAGESSLASQSYTQSDLAGGALVNAGAVNDGTADPGSGLGGDEYTPNGTATFTFNLNVDPLTGGSATGYTLQQLDLYSGYNGGFFQQDFQVYVETTTSGGQFNAISSSDFVNDTYLGTNDVVNRTEITDTTGSIASNVIAIRLYDATVITKEFDVFGEATPAATSPAVPEPSTYALLLGGLALLALHFRRRHSA